MEDLVAELNNAYECCFNDIIEVDRNYISLLGGKKNACSLKGKGKKVSLKKAVHLNQSEENFGLDWGIEPSLRQQPGGGEQLVELAEKLSETQSELMQAKEIIKSLSNANNLENVTHRKTQEELEESRSQITKLSDKLSLAQLELKESKERITHLEHEIEVEKSTHRKTKDELENVKLQIKTEDEKSSQTKSQVAQLKARLAALETDYHMEKSTDQKTKEELEIKKLHHKTHNDKNNPIHIQLSESREMIKCLENDLHFEKSEHGKTKEVLEKAKDQNREQDKINIQNQIEMKQLKKKIKHLENDLRTEKSAHLKTREVLEASKCHGTVTDISISNQAKNKKTFGKEQPNHLAATIEEFHAQLQQTISEKSCLKDSYEREKAAHQDTKEELEEAKAQIKVLSDKCERRRMKDTSVTNRYISSTDDVNESDIFQKMYKREMSDLRTKIENCTAFLEASLNEKLKLEEKLSNVDTVYAKREENYVKLINMYIVEAHNLKTNLKKHISKCNKPLQKKVRSWINKNILRKPSDTPHNIEEPPHLYPDDWRLPGIPNLWWKSKVGSKHDQCSAQEQPN